MMQSDLIFSLGPNCRSTWNLRHHLGVERAYPFDWWITPARSMLRMIDPEFSFTLSMADLHLVGNSVYNARLNLLHHHDFARDGDGVVLPLTESAVSECQSKYQWLFRRLHDDVRRSMAPVAVLNGCYAGWPEGYYGMSTPPELNGRVPPDELALTVRQRLGERVRVVLVNEGLESVQSHDWGCVVTLPDRGYREAPPGSEYAEPVHVFREAYTRIGLQRIEGPVAQGSKAN
jgi:hypothetical protein